MTAKVSPLPLPEDRDKLLKLRQTAVELISLSTRVWRTNSGAVRKRRPNKVTAEVISLWSRIKPYTATVKNGDNNQLKAARVLRDQITERLRPRIVESFEPVDKSYPLVCKVGAQSIFRFDADGEITGTEEVEFKAPDWLTNEVEWKKPECPLEATPESIVQWIDYTTWSLQGLRRFMKIPDAKLSGAAKSAVAHAYMLVRILKQRDEFKHLKAPRHVEPVTIPQALDVIEALRESISITGLNSSQSEMLVDQRMHLEKAAAESKADLQHRLDLAEHCMSPKQKMMFRKLRCMKPCEVNDIALDSQANDAAKKMAQRIETKLQENSEIDIKLEIDGDSLLLKDDRRN